MNNFSYRDIAQVNVQLAEVYDSIASVKEDDAAGIDNSDAINALYRDLEDLRRIILENCNVHYLKY